MSSQINEISGVPHNGIVCLCFAARFHHIESDPKKVSEALGRKIDAGISKAIAYAADLINLSARTVQIRTKDLNKIELPALAFLNNGETIAILQLSETHALVFDPTDPKKPKFISLELLNDIWSKKIVLLKKKLEITGDDVQFDIWTIARVLGKSKNILVEIILASFMIQLFGLATPLLTQVIIDKVVVHKNLDTLYVLGVGICLVMIFETILTATKGYLVAHIAARTDAVVSSNVFEHLLRLPLRYFESRNVGGIATSIHELENIRSFLTGPAISALLDSVFTIIYIVVMLIYSPILTLIVLVTVPCLATVSLLTHPAIRRRLNVKNECGAANHSFLVESISGIHSIKSLAAEQEFTNRWQKKLESYGKAVFRTAALASHSAAVGQLIQKISNVVILCVGANLVIKGSLSVGELIAFQILSSRALQPMLRITQMWENLQQVKISIDRLGDIMNSKKESFRAASQKFPDKFKSLTFSNVGFRYPGATNSVIHNISFRVDSNQRIAIVGRSGSGKSTLSNLLQRLYTASAGSILINDVDILRFDVASLRRKIGIVLQDNFLFSGTIRENICGHLKYLDNSALLNAAKLSGANEFIDRLPDGYDTKVSEGGTSLSGGQRQRIAIARALIGNPEILIFDEATSALDAESASIFGKNFSAICANRTVFVITHDLLTVKQMDKILFIEEGILSESGTHEELLKLNGGYSRLFYVQGNI